MDSEGEADGGMEGETEGVEETGRMGGVDKVTEGEADAEGEGDKSFFNASSAEALEDETSSTW